MEAPLLRLPPFEVPSAVVVAVGRPLSKHSLCRAFSQSLNMSILWLGPTTTFCLLAFITVLIGYYDYHPVAKSPKIGSYDCSQIQLYYSRFIAM